jgi:hypothetical protein
MDNDMLVIILKLISMHWMEILERHMKVRQNLVTTTNIKSNKWKVYNLFDKIK